MSMGPLIWPPFMHRYHLGDDAFERSNCRAICGKENADLYHAFICSYVALLLDSPIDSAKPEGLVKRFVYTILDSDPKVFLTHYSSLADSILQSMQSTSDYTITGEFLDDMKDTPIFREYLHFFRTGDPSTLTFILSFLNFGKKMNYSNNDLESAAFRDWLDIEKELGTYDFSFADVKALRTIISQLIPRVDDTLLLPKHGPGYTSEGLLDPLDKLDRLSLDRKSKFCFRANSFGRVGVDRGSLIDEYFDRVEEEQIAKLKFVPKSVKAMRSICMETASRMFLQQEVARWLITTMERSKLSHIIDLKDQTHNQRYAEHGSYSQACDTIDLSAASDRVHIDLIRAVFPPQVLYYLLGTRTSKVMAAEGVVKLKKFAPMGSALCFPVQSILFASITLLAYLKHYYGCALQDDYSEEWFYLHHVEDFIDTMHTEPGEMLPRLLTPRVYGDDIISDYRTTDHVLHLLSRFGLAINVSKSFIGGTPFRESCGIFAYNGYNVTPLLFRIPSFGKRLDSKAFASLIDAANRAGDFGYSQLRSYYINFLKHAHVAGLPVNRPEFIPFVTDRDNFGIYTTNIHNHGLVLRQNQDLQREEKRVAILKPVRGERRESPCYEQYFYDQWVRARIHGGSTENTYSVPRVRPLVTRVGLGWTPA